MRLRSITLGQAASVGLGIIFVILAVILMSVLTLGKIPSPPFPVGWITLALMVFLIGLYFLGEYQPTQRYTEPETWEELDESLKDMEREILMKVNPVLAKINLWEAKQEERLTKELGPREEA